MTPLPIDRFLPAMVAAVGAARAVVLVAPPGAGKTTRAPPALLAAGLLDPAHPNLVMLQPRRVAARGAAQRIADENGWELGREVGYQVRFERVMGANTRLRVVTEGILARQLLDDPFLEGVGAVLLDEFHERSLYTDTAIALLREVRQTVREDLILVVMSATLEAEPVAKFLGGCPVVRAEGRAFPVDLTYEPPSTAAVPERVAAAVRSALSHPREESGDVLAFLPGADQIRRTMRLLETEAGRDGVLILPLHGSLPFEEQARALRPSDVRKVILATNIAETSLTIPGVRTVIDSGLARVAGYDPQRGLDRLELKRISKASAAQRAGRAGRTSPGRCVRLWTAKEDAALDPFELPEIRRVDLCGTVLALHAWGKSDPRAFGWFEAPPEAALAAAERLLAMLGALSDEKDGKITDVGRRIITVPAHPRLARLLVAAADGGLVGKGAALAALLSEKDIALPAAFAAGPDGAGRRRPLLHGSSDVLLRLDMLAEAERQRFAPWLRDAGIDPDAARQVARARDDLERTARRIAPAKSCKRGASDDDEVLKLTLLAYPDRVCRRRANDPHGAAMVGGGGARLAGESVVRTAEFFVAVDARQDDRATAREALVRVASAIDPAWLEELFPGSVARRRSVVFDESRGRVVSLGVTAYRDLVLREDTDAAVDPALAAEVLAEAVRPRAAEIFAGDEAATTFLARVNLLRTWMPEHPWPEFGAAELGEVLAGACAGRRSIDEMRRQPLVPLLRGRLNFPLDRLLDEQAPESLAVPTGNRVRLEYERGKPPVLAVRLQELFGWADTPRVAGGRVPVLLHLLGPNYRPVQITADLRSFWADTYFQVRKDLRTRYPKHSWPEDPLSAKPEARGRRRRAD